MGIDIKRLKLKNRIFAVTKIVLFAHVFNWLWRKREKRREVRANVVSVVIADYFKRYLESTSKVEVKDPVKNDKNEKIYSIWFQGEENAPELVKACFRSVRRNCSQEHLVLNDKTIFDYIELPDVIVDKYRKGNIAKAHFADISRVELLHNYGGFWMDATDFVSSPIPDNIIKEDFFMYMAGNAGSPYSFVQNCFIRSRKGSYLLEAWRAMILEYWKNEPREMDYFMHQLLFKSLVLNDKRAKKFFEKMPHIDQDPTHALWWAYNNKKFDKKIFDDITSKVFFQKLTYRGASNPEKGTFADVIINM